VGLGVKGWVGGVCEGLGAVFSGRKPVPQTSLPSSHRTTTTMFYRPTVYRLDACTSRASPSRMASCCVRRCLR
jgi:hypothetical protein